MEETEYFNSILRYLDKQMSKEEKHDFEYELGLNPALYEEYEKHKEVDTYLEDKKLLEFNDKLQELESLYPLPRKKKAVWYYMAAVFLLLCAGMTALTYFFSGPSNEAIFAEYYSYTSSSMVVRNADNSNNLLEVGIKAYDNKEFENAVQLLEQIQTDNKEHISAYFYIGLSSIEMKKYTNAIEYFEYLETQPAHIYTDQVKWYLSLCYIVTGQVERSTPLLKSLVDEGMAFESRAIEVLEKLE